MPNTQTAPMENIPNVMMGIGRTPKLSKGHILYYPGAGTDYGPLEYFAIEFESELPLGAAFYVDYLAREVEIKSMFRKMPHLNEARCVQTEKLKSTYLHQSSWTKYWPENHPLSRGFANPRKAYAITSELSFEDQQPLRFHFFRTEAVQTYENLLAIDIIPSIVVIQDHGFGGNWTRFGGANEMFRLALQYRSMPEFLLVADNSEAWPGYVAMSRPLRLRGQMHDHVRTVYRRDYSVSETALLHSAY